MVIVRRGRVNDSADLRNPLHMVIVLIYINKYAIRRLGYRAQARHF